MVIKQYWSQILSFALGLLLGYFLFADKRTIVTTPPIIGKFEPAVPISQKPVGEPLTVIWKTKTEYIKVKTEGKANDSIIKKFTDSLITQKEQLEILTSAVTYREFSHTFEDEFLKAEIKGLTQGYLENVSIPQYEIKSQEIPIPTYHRILAGAEIGNNTLLNDFQYKLNLGFQTPNGTIYKAAYSKQGEIDYVWIGGEFTVFKF